MDRYIICIAESLSCASEAGTTLLIGQTPIFKKEACSRDCASEHKSVSAQVPS